MDAALTRANGAVTKILALLLLSLGLLPSLLLEGRAPILAWVMDPAWPALSLFGFLMTALIPFVLLGLYAFQRPRIGLAGGIGLFLALAGTVALLCFQFDMAFVWPLLALHAPELVDFGGPMFRATSFGFIHVWMGPVSSVGYLVFGVATYRARVFPRWAAVLWIFGMILSLGILFPPLIVRVLGAAPAVVALLVMGSIQWRGGLGPAGGARRAMGGG